MESQSELTSAQTIKQILELCEIFGMPNEAVQNIRKKCWYLADSESTRIGNGNNHENISMED